MTDRTTPQEASRAPFEAWMKGNYAASWGEWYLMKTPAGEYVYSEGEWDAWQAATQARDAEVKALRDALTELATHFRGTNADDGQCDKALQIAANSKDPQQ